jgi:hypothetical protein
MKTRAGPSPIEISIIVACRNEAETVIEPAQRDRWVGRVGRRFWFDSRR